MYHSPLKLYEYRSMGKPVIASAFDDARGLLGDKRSGFLFDPEDPKSLKQALKEAYHGRSSFDREGTSIREDILRNHGWEARVREMILRIEMILEEKA